MSVEGLRAWIGEIERKLGKRTRVFLALTVIAIGIAGASLYLAIEARNDSVSEGDVRALQEKLEARIDEAASGAAAGSTVPPAEVEPAPQPRETQPKSGGKQDQSPQGGNGAGGGASGSSPGATGSAPKSSSGGSKDKSARILELLEQTKKQNSELEAKQKAEAQKNAP